MENVFFMNKSLKIMSVLVLGLLFFSGCTKDNSKRYEKIKKDFEEGVVWYNSVRYPTCQEGGRGTVTSDFLISQGYIKKEILLDVDGKSYCKANAERKCINGENDYTIYLKCQDYEDEGYVDW